MGILFKTYKGKHQLQIYREVWQMKQKAQLDEVLGLFAPKEAMKAKWSSRHVGGIVLHPQE